MITFNSDSFNTTKESIDTNFKEITRLYGDISTSIGRILNTENMNSESWKVFNSKYNTITKDMENISNKLDNIKAYLASVARSKDSIEDSLNKAFSGLNG